MSAYHLRFNSLVEMLQRRAAEHPGARAFTLLPDGETEGPVLDYGTLDRKARAIAATLQSMDAVGQRALLLYPFSLDYLAAFFGSLYSRVIAVPVYPPDPGRLERTLPRLRAVVADSTAALVLTTGAIRAMVDSLVGLAPEFARLRFVATDAINEESASAWREPDIVPATLAFLQYTSGSTSSPKGLMVTHRNLLHNEELCRQSTRLGRESVWVSWLPMYHDMGLIGGLLHPIYVGAPCYLLPPQTFLQRPLRWLRTISHYRATISGGPNFAYDLCVRKITIEERDQLDLSAWNYAFNGAEPVRKDTLDRFTRYFAPSGFAREALRPLYGLAEATLEVTGGVRGTLAPTLSIDASALLMNRVVQVAPGHAGSREFVGCGGTFLDRSIAIADPDTCTPRPSGEVGEIWVMLDHAPGGDLANLALKAGIITSEERLRIHDADEAREEAIQVDSFDPHLFAGKGWEPAWRSMSRGS